MSQLEILRLNNNLLETIQVQAFANLSSLKRIYAGHNNLKIWNKDWFSNSDSIEIIDFQSNQIRTIPEKAFGTFQKLKEIHFENNLLETIENEAFGNLNSLQFVGLGHNKLKELNENIFPLRLEIDYLQLNENLLNYISSDVLKKILPKNINLHYNPWNCQCLEKIYQWIRLINGSLDKNRNCYDENIPECAIPKNDKQKCGEYIDDELTKSYLESLKTISRISERCARTVIESDTNNTDDFIFPDERK